MGNFSIQLQAYAKSTGERLEVVARDVVLDVGRRLVERSPVGNPELWAINDETMFQRASHQAARADVGPVKPLSARSLAKSFKTKAPAGYVGGRFRANWQYGFGEAPSGDLPDIDASGGLSIARITDGVSRFHPAGVHYIVNNLPYAQRLENGWSTQAPSGMVELTTIEFQQILDEAVAKGATP